MSDKFKHTFSEILEPVLIQHGFHRIKLKDCMWPEFLFQKDRLWFSVSWDWRDMYFDASLGHLHWFKDVMPRVVVIGDYSCYDNKIKWDSIKSEEDIEITLNRMSESLESAIMKYESDYSKIFEDYRVSRGRRSGINIDEYIGDEVTEKSLKPYCLTRNWSLPGKRRSK